MGGLGLEDAHNSGKGAIVTRKTRTVLGGSDSSFHQDR